jgi:hypothetical protein
MNNRNNIENEIQEQLTSLDDKIIYYRKYYPKDPSIGYWEDKVNALIAAQSYLNGYITLEELNTALIKDYPKYSYDWSVFSDWYPGKSGTTYMLIEKVKCIQRILNQTQAFTQNNAIVHENKKTNPVANLNVSDFLSSSSSDMDNTQSFFQYNPLPELLNHAALGEWDAARKIWLSDPSILEKKGSVSHSGRYEYKNLTAYQIAWMNEEEDIIAEMESVMSYEQQQQQYNEIFPHGKPCIEYDYNLEEAKQLLQNFYNALLENNEDMLNTNSQDALKALHTYLSPNKFNQCQQGLVFDVNIYHEAIKMYEANRMNFKKERHLMFLCTRVNEVIASRLSTGYLRAHSQGIFYIVNNGAKIKGDGCKLSDGSPYFAFQRENSNKPGINCFITYKGEIGKHPGETPLDDAQRLEKLIVMKNNKLVELSKKDEIRLTL